MNDQLHYLTGTNFLARLFDGVAVSFPWQAMPGRLWCVRLHRAGIGLNVGQRVLGGLDVLNEQAVENRGGRFDARLRVDDLSWFDARRRVEDAPLFDAPQSNPGCVSAAEAGG